MATDGIDIPSPSVFLRSDTPPNPTDQQFITTTAAKVTTKPRTTLAQRPAVPVPVEHHSTKPKQSKSRNGCITCKAKRLKCDEEKPGCQQCARRKVECGGYKKDFKWRPFEDSIVKINIDKAKSAAHEQTRSPATSPEKASTVLQPIPSTFTEPDRAKARRLDTDETSELDTGPSPKIATPPPTRPKSKTHKKAASTSLSTSPTAGQSVRVTPSVGSTSKARHDSTRAQVQTGRPAAPTQTVTGQNFIDVTQEWPPELPSASSLTPTSPFQDETFSYFDLDYTGILPADNLSPTLTELVDPFLESDAFTDGLDTFSSLQELLIPAVDADLNLEAFTQQESADSDQQVALISGTDWNTMGAFSMLDNAAVPQVYGPIDYLYSQPTLAPDSAEMLCLRFDRLTCGILSVMDGPTENPWRSLIWPLAQQSQALYHAVTAMTAFHSSTDIPLLRLAGHRHKQKSIRYIQEGIRDNSISDQTAIATALALGFSESWDQHTASGNTHIKGAQALVKRALAEHRVNPLQGEELARLKFLCNAWVYMDVIARLTAVDSDESNDFDNAFLFSPDAVDSTGLGTGFGIDFGMPIDARLDPLMGCASTLFPLIGRVANLVKKVFRSRSNSPSIISQANDLKLRLETWEPPEFIEPPEDPTSQVQHALQTAEAYRWATLLHLHQSVPELPSASSAELGQKVLTYLATVPLASRTVIVQIYPLMVAGCEASTSEDQEWVRDRWLAMSARMRIGVIDKCITVVEEVWRRREAYEAQPSQHRRRLIATADLQLPRSGHGSLKRPHTGFAGDDGSARQGLVFGWNDPNGEVIRDEPVIPERPSRSTIGSMDPAYTVRGQLHWVGVMFEYGWEVLLG